MVDSPPGIMRASHNASCSGVRTGMKLNVVFLGKGTGGVVAALRRSWRCSEKAPCSAAMRLEQQVLISLMQILEF